jgi:serpin B
MQMMIMNRIGAPVLCGLLVGAVMTAMGGTCSSQATAKDTQAQAPGAPGAPPAQTAAVESLVDGNTQFALDLYARLRAQEDGNLFCSPYSISTALAMTWAGARTQTADQMAQTLHFEGPQNRVAAAFGELARSLEDSGGEDEPARVELAIANRLWGQQGETFLDPFLDTIRTSYGGGLKTVDFLADLEESRKTINDWVADQTRDRIRDLLRQGDLSPGMLLVLTNAIYFKGDWLTQFDPEKTRDGRFFINDEKAVEVPMMSLKSDFGLFESDDLQVLEMPYDGQRLAMVILLPRARDGLADLEEMLSDETLDAWLEELAVRETQVFLPRFKVTSRFDLGQTLEQMGMPLAFTPGRADFSGMNGRRDLFIGKVIHQAWVKVDEEGTEAAAATAVGMMTTSLERPPLFNANHPFLFMIRDRETGSILFIGRVVDPS